MNNILDTCFTKDGFWFLAVCNRLASGDFDYVISIKSEANLKIHFRCEKQINNFMKQLAIQIERIDRLTFALVIDCLSICAAGITEITTRERILNQLALYM